MIHAADITGLPIPAKAYIMDGIGKSFEQQYTRLFIDNNTEYKEAYTKQPAFKLAFYEKYNTLKPRLYDGVIELLSCYQKMGYFLAIATSGSRNMLDRLLPMLHITQYFNITCSASEFAAKPAPDMLHYIMEQSGCTQTNTVMIGDTIYDIQAAKNAGIDVVLVHGVVPEKEAVTHILPNIQGLRQIILSDL